MGRLAETLLDEAKEGHDEVMRITDDTRRKTRNRKREIAEERRSKAPVRVSSCAP